MSYDWKNKVVIITGAASGIGAIVVRLLIDEGVKHVAVLDLAEQVGIALQNELNSKTGTQTVKFYKCDVTKDEQLLEAFNSVKHEHGYIDVLINNAGIMNDSLNVYKKEIEVNVTALITGSLKAMEMMRKDMGGRGGTIINIASIAGISKEPYMPIYFATKAAVIQFSNCLGVRKITIPSNNYNATGVRVLSICFGATNTSLLSTTKLGSIEKDDTVLLSWLRSLPLQSPENAAKGMIEAYKKGESSSVWLIANRPAEDITEKYNTMYESVKDVIY